MVGKNIYRLLPSANQAVGNMFRRICNPPKFTIRICNPLKPHIYKMMYVGERVANPHLETAGLQIRRNKYAYTWTADEPLNAKCLIVSLYKYGGAYTLQMFAVVIC